MSPRNPSTATTARRAGLGLLLATAVAVVPLAAPATGAAKGPAKGPVTAPTSPTTTHASATSGYTYVRAAAPARTIVKNSAGAVVAVLTDGARTAVLNGPSRTFAESTTTATVTTSAWVRLLPAAFSGTVDPVWLSAALSDTSDDVLALARQFTTGAVRDASYGPLVDGVRQEGSDWNDYLGVTATYDASTDSPEPAQLGSLDCSGFVRMTFGHLSGVPMTLDPDGLRLARRAVQMAATPPGVVLVPNTGTQVKTFSSLQAGDLVFFDAATDDGAAVDHVGIYLGKDSAGSPRFVSSRKSVDGPTMGDVRGRSVLSGTGLYATSYRQATRL